MSYTTLISPAELAALPAAGSCPLLVVDCRFDLSDTARGERAWAKAHLPGAVYANLDRDLSDLSRPGLGRHPLPDPDSFAAVLVRWGWTPATQVVAYDDAGGATAARLWWMLRLIGHHDAAVLDGGFPDWVAAGLPLTHDVPFAAACDVDIGYDPGQVVYAAELERELAADRVLLLDARGAARFRGEVEPIDKVAGHVPGAQNRPYTENLGVDGGFKPASDLRNEFETLLGEFTPDHVVHMCGSGVTACHNLLAMEHAGLAGSRIFAPSWSGWIADAQRPVARGVA